MRYRLEYKEPYIIKTEMMKNRTHQTYRWKTIALSEELEKLKEYQKNNSIKNGRIIDTNNKDRVVE